MPHRARPRAFARAVAPPGGPPPWGPGPHPAPPPPALASVLAVPETLLFPVASAPATRSPEQRAGRRQGQRQGAQSPEARCPSCLFLSITPIPGRFCADPRPRGASGPMGLPAAAQHPRALTGEGPWGQGDLGPMLQPSPVSSPQPAGVGVGKHGRRPLPQVRNVYKCQQGEEGHANCQATGKRNPKPAGHTSHPPGQLDPQSQQGPVWGEGGKIGTPTRPVGV